MSYLLTAQEMQEMDRYTIEKIGINGSTLMETAGRGIAEKCREITSNKPCRVTIVCGKGNNGGDGFVIARVLKNWGYRPTIYLLGKLSELKGDARWAYTTVTNSFDTEELKIIEAYDQQSLESIPMAIAHSNLVVDAVFGTGLSKDIKGYYISAIEEINRSNCPVVAVDIPSGVNSNSGMIMGCAVKADYTVSMAFCKRGHFLYPSKELTGELSVVDIGIPSYLPQKQHIRCRSIGYKDLQTLLPERPNDSHKGSYGHLAIWAGSTTTPGAASLAVKAALRSGVGLVSWVASGETVNFAKTLPPDAMLRLISDEMSDKQQAESVVTGSTGIAAGCGITTDFTVQNQLKELLQCNTLLPICLDADALNILSLHKDWWNLVKSPCVITPHPREMSRLTGIPVHEINENRCQVAVDFAKSNSVVVVLKGADTVIANHDGSIAIIEDSGCSALATGGSGDVLAGVIGALLAQGLSVFDAAQAGVIIHRTAGFFASKTHGLAGTTASDIVESIGAVFKSVDS